MDSRYAAAAKEEEKMFSAVMFNPKLVNFFKYPARDLVELLVMKNNCLPILLSMSIVSGTPSINESPFQMTPSQSKINVLVLSSNFFASAMSILRCLCAIEAEICVVADTLFD